MATPNPLVSRDPRRTVSYLLNILLAGICITLVVQNRQLKSAKAEEPASTLEPGTQLETFRYRTLEGEEAEFPFSNPRERHFLFIFTTSCPYCEGSLSEVQTLADLTSNNEHVRIWGVSLDNHDRTVQYFISNGLRFPLITVREDLLSRFGSFGVPMFILLTGDGIVERVWRGELKSDRRTEILSLLNDPKAAGRDPDN